MRMSTGSIPEAISSARPRGSAAKVATSKIGSRLVAYDRLDVPPPEGPDWVSVSGALLAFVLMAVMRAAHDHVRGSVKDLSIPS